MKLKAFTLVEMLIVMGIIVILMAVGIASGRFAIRRANKIEHQNAAEQIYQASQSYYSDFKEFPGKTTALTVEDLMAPEVLGAYIDDFDGGSEASYTYVTDDTAQEMLVCVTYGGIQDENDLGMYCAGNGIGSDLISGAPTTKEIEFASTEYNEAVVLFEDNCSAWDSSDGWDEQTCTVAPATEDDSGVRPPPASPFL
jgi:prepilin-type N-terminal cleavage/methylation domain-containing protein